MTPSSPPPEQGPLLSVIVVTFNHEDTLAQLLTSWTSQASGQDLEVLVVDNASTDRSVELSRDFPLTLLPQEHNLGYTAGANLGAAAASGRFLLFCNPDIFLPDPATPARVLDFLSTDPPEALWYAAQLDALGAEREVFQPFPWFPQFCLRRFGLGTWGSNAGWLEGSFLLLRRNTFRSLGGFDERFVQFGEDLDFCYRAAAAGLSPQRLHGLTVIHRAPTTTEAKRRLVWENRRLFYSLHGHHWHAHLARLILATLRRLPRAK